MKSKAKFVFPGPCMIKARAKFSVRKSFSGKEVIVRAKPAETGEAATRGAAEGEVGQGRAFVDRKGGGLGRGG